MCQRGVTAPPVHYKDTQQVMHGQSRKCGRGNFKPAIVVADERMTVQHLPDIPVPVKQRVLDIEVAEEVLAGKDVEHGPFPIDSAGLPTRKALEVPGREIAVFDAHRERVVVVEHVECLSQEGPVKREIDSLQGGLDVRAMRADAGDAAGDGEAGQQIHVRGSQSS